jgi:WhiB family redox-sensing transcriptional regulator
MPVLIRGRQARSRGSTRDANAHGARNNEVEVLCPPKAETFGSSHGSGRPGRPAKASCRGMGPGFFFPTNSVAFARAERVCARCPAAAQCLAAALEDPSLHGIWGGTSARERQYLRSEEGLGWG